MVQVVWLLEPWVLALPEAPEVLAGLVVEVREA